MQKNKPTEIFVQIVELLTPLASEERHRVLQAAMTILGEAPVKIDKNQNAKDETGDDSLDGISPRARSWIKQNGLMLEEIQQVFHISDGNIEVITSEIPGRNQKAQTLNAYVLMGIANLLLTGNSSFDDKSARALCKTHGCFNEANHAFYMKDKGNEIVGSKEKGWGLTTPGLKRGAVLVKELNKLKQ